MMHCNTWPWTKQRTGGLDTYQTVDTKKLQIHTQQQFHVLFPTWLTCISLCQSAAHLWHHCVTSLCDVTLDPLFFSVGTSSFSARPAGGNKEKKHRGRLFSVMMSSPAGPGLGGARWVSVYRLSQCFCDVTATSFQILNPSSGVAIGAVMCCCVCCHGNVCVRAASASISSWHRHWQKP